jgi:hypothetical protein
VCRLGPLVRNGTPSPQFYHTHEISTATKHYPTGDMLEAKITNGMETPLKKCTGTHCTTIASEAALVFVHVFSKHLRLFWVEVPYNSMLSIATQ